MPIDPNSAINAISSASTITEIAKNWFPTLNKFVKWLRTGKTKIAIMGAGGTGKTTLAKLFAGEEIFGLAQPYQESINIDEYAIDMDGTLEGSLIVVPGQEPREDRWNEVLQKLVDGKIKILINIVSWGYHSFSSFSYSNHPLYLNNMSLEEFMKIYQKNRLDREIKVLEKIQQPLSIAKKNKVAMITLITKQDLWWRKKSEVEKYYTNPNNNYNKIIQSIQNQRGQNNFIHEYLSISLIIENFTSGTNEILIPTSEGYEQKTQIFGSQELIQTIKNLCESS